MAITAEAGVGPGLPENLTVGARQSALDRWIYVFTAAIFIVVALAGFLPESVHKIGLVQAGRRAPFPLILHLHAVLMGSFLLLLLMQTILAAKGRIDRHAQLGLAGLVLAPALVIVGFALVPTMYHLAWSAAQSAPAPARIGLARALRGVENTLLLQIRTGILFPLLMFIGLRARVTAPGLHKRLMILAIAPALTAAVARIGWLPTTLPTSPTSVEIVVLLLIAPMFLLDLVRIRSVHPAYWIWLGLVLPSTFVVHALWDTPWWHAAARRVLGV